MNEGFVRRYLGIVVFLMSIVLAMLFGNWIECNYSSKGEVYKVEGEVITLRDGANELWFYETKNKEELREKDKVKIYFNNNNTERDRTDDTITKVKRINNKTTN